MRIRSPAQSSVVPPALCVERRCTEPLPFFRPEYMARAILMGWRAPPAPTSQMMPPGLLEGSQPWLQVSHAPRAVNCDVHGGPCPVAGRPTVCSVFSSVGASQNAECARPLVRMYIQSMRISTCILSVSKTNHPPHWSYRSCYSFMRRGGTPWGAAAPPLPSQAFTAPPAALAHAPCFKSTVDRWTL